MPKMPVKRKRDLLDFDPNKSDPEDENFEPGDDGDDKRRRGNKRSRSAKSKGGPRRRDRYNGSDIDDDEDEIISDSEGAGFFEDDEEEDEDDNGNLPVNATGRRMRKAAAQQHNYKESSEEPEESEPESDVVHRGGSRKKPAARASRPSHIVTLKTNPKNLKSASKAPKEPPTPSVTTRRTRARTEEVEEFMELTTSGRHAQSTRAATKSKSPEVYSRGSRNNRGGKGLKKPPMPIEEATQESSAQDSEQAGAGGTGGDGASDDVEAKDPDVEVADSEGADPEDQPRRDAPEEEHEGVEPGGEADDIDDEDELAVDSNYQRTGQGGEGGADEAEDHGAADDDDDDDDVLAPGTRRTRAARASISGPVAEEAEDESENVGSTRRLTRRRTLRKKSMAEPSSDFEPGDESGEGEEASVASAAESGRGGRRGGRRRANTADEGDEEYSSNNSRGRRASQQRTRKSTRQRQAKESADEEVDLDRDELAEELEELRQSSRSRRRRRSPSIAYEQALPKRRRVTRVVDYSIKPLDQLMDQDEEEDAAPTPVRGGGRRGGRNGANSAWQRSLVSTFGPFGGGGGLGSVLGGPWGRGATGGVESDSSDDEGAGVRPGGLAGGAVGMTPTSAALPALGQPLNLEGITGVAATPNLGRVRSQNQKALADADPLGVDQTVDFSKVGGLQGHIDQLKEMLMLPLLYPELFSRYKVTPPRGVLFHGPPGTGKTLLARALSNAVGIGGRKITFYMRKGADALSKWVGEAEKQLRLLFEEARRTQPSIIFFDEIDGLAPVRSSKQEQIHASIVSTLLALMDGMDGRGQVIVIGATNRPDSVDPALRRPGRFDREFYFPLPDVEGRRAIIDIHTRDWGLTEEFRDSLAHRTKGYGGADLRALCTEAALNSIQRTYPQIYSSTEKLVVDPDRIAVHTTDFILSMKKMVPSSERSASSAAAPLPPSIQPLLRNQLASVIKVLDQQLPRRKKTTALEEAMFEPYDDADHGFGRENMGQEFERLRIFRPRLLISGRPGMGQEYISAAVLHHLEGVHVQNFDLATLVGDGAPMEQVMVRLFTEVKRHKPAVIFVPNIGTWFATVSDAAYRTFVTMLRAIPATDPVLLLATAEEDVSTLPEELVRDLFGFSRKSRRDIHMPGRDDRQAFFANIAKFVKMAPSEFPDPSQRRVRILEDLPVAPAPPPRQRSKDEIERELHQDHIYLNILKVQLQPIMDQIKQKYRKFRNSVIPVQQIEYLWQETDPNFVRADVGAPPAHSVSAPELGVGSGSWPSAGLGQGVTGGVGSSSSAAGGRPYVIARDKNGVEGLREVATNRFFYNLDVATIEERLSNGFYARPIDFFTDIESLAKDARSIGDRERTLKANELVSNVRVDVHEVGARLQHIDFNALLERQRQRAAAAEEKQKRRAAMRSVVESVRPDVEMGGMDGADGGPVRIGAPVPGAMGSGAGATTSARFRVMSPLLQPNNGEAGPPTARPGSSNGGLSNGNSVPSRAGGSGEHDSSLHSTQHLSQMGPPPAGPRRYTQVSAVTTLPPGVSPSAMVNDASTTRSSDLSSHNNRSSLDPWSTQATNGLHSSAGPETPSQPQSQPPAGSGPRDNSQVPDTQSLGGPSQSTSSESQWAHSQAQGIARGELEARAGAGVGVGAGGFGGIPSGQTSPTSSQLQSSGHRSSGSGGSMLHRRHGLSMASLVGDDDSPHSHFDRHHAAQTLHMIPHGASSSASSSQQALVLHVDHIAPFLLNLTERTSGCTVDQLEHINRELMDELWATRGEWNRDRVLNRLTSVYNETIKDIEDTQGSFPNTQELANASRFAGSSRNRAGDVLRH